MRSQSFSLAILLWASPCAVQSFSLLMSSGKAFEAAALARSRLGESFSTLSGKLTMSPEIVIPDPTDPTALLLQSTKIKALSERLRSRAKANSLWISGPLSSVQAITSEQQDALGSFPGPLPVIYCDWENKPADCSFPDLAAAGASGVLLTISHNPVTCHDDVTVTDELKAEFEASLECGVQPIPEVVLDARSQWEEEDVVKLVDTVIDQCGVGEPVSILLSFSVVDSSIEEEDMGDESGAIDEGISLPSIPKELKKKLAILGSVRVLAGENRMGLYLDHLKSKGFSGSVLRSDCVPGFRMNPDLDAVEEFWSAAIADLKSTKSKTFSFRSKNNMESCLSTEWFNYQKDVMTSGALGESSAESARQLDDANGDYMGF